MKKVIIETVDDVLDVTFQLYEDILEECLDFEYIKMYKTIHDVSPSITLFYSVGLEEFIQRMGIK